MPDPTKPQLPDLSAWQKAIPYIAACATALLTGFATNNWVVSGPEAIKNGWNIFSTLGLTGGTLISAFITLWTAVSNNTATKGIIQRLHDDLQSVRSGIDPASVNTFLTGLQSVLPDSQSNSPTLLLPGFALTLDPSIFGKPDADARAKLVASIQAFLANLEPKTPPNPAA